MRKLLLITSVILVCCILCACQKNENNNNNNQNNSGNQREEVIQEEVIQKESPEDIKRKDEERIKGTLNILNSNPDSHKDGSKYIKKIDDNHYGVYYFNGQDIAGYEYYIKCESSGDAELAKAAYDDSNQTVENIYIFDNMMVVKMSSNGYEGTTLESVEDLINSK